MKNSGFNDESTEIIIGVGIIMMFAVPPLAPLIILAFVIWFFRQKKRDLNLTGFLDDISKNAAEQTLRAIEVSKEKKKRENEKRRVFKRKYLRSEDWEMKRQKRFEIDGNCCALCYANEKLECHHITYENLGHEPLEDLRTVCRDCHQEIHDTYGYPSQDELNYLDGWFWK